MRLFKNFKPTTYRCLTINSAKTMVNGAPYFSIYKTANGVSKTIKAKILYDDIFVYNIKKVNRKRGDIHIVDGQTIKRCTTIIHVYRIPVNVIKALELNVIQHNRHFTIE